MDGVEEVAGHLLLLFLGVLFLLLALLDAWLEDLFEVDVFEGDGHQSEVVVFEQIELELIDMEGGDANAIIVGPVCALFVLGMALVFNCLVDLFDLLDVLELQLLLGGLGHERKDLLQKLDVLDGNVDFIVVQIAAEMVEQLNAHLVKGVLPFDLRLQIPLPLLRPVLSAKRNRIADSQKDHEIPKQSVVVVVLHHLVPTHIARIAIIIIVIIVTVLLQNRRKVVFARLQALLLDDLDRVLLLLPCRHDQTSWIEEHFQKLKLQILFHDSGA